MREVIMMVVLMAVLTGAAPARGDDGGTRPTTEAALVDAAMDAIKKNDAAAYVALFLQPAEAKEHCSEMMADPKMAEVIDNIRKEAEPNIRKKLGKCHDLIDFSKATRLRVEGGGERKSKPEKGCKDLYELKDILVYLKVGEKTYRVKIDDPFVMGSGLYGVIDDPRCYKE